MITCDVAIVGGGLSGLYAARLLRKASIDVMLIEARSHSGGRIQTVDDEGQPTEDGFDLGASWYWPYIQPAIGELIAELGLSSFTQNTDGDVLFERMSREPVHRFSGMGQEQASRRLIGGTARLINALTCDMPADRLLLNHRVTEMALTDTEVCLACQSSEGLAETIMARHVIAALPPRLLEATVTFTPALEKTDAVHWRETPTWMAPHAKFFALYERPFWRDDRLSGTAQSMVGPMVEIHDATTSSGKAALMGFIGVPAAQRRLIDEETLAKACVGQLGRLFGPLAAKPQATLLKDWATDPLTATEADIASGGHITAANEPWVTGAWRKRLTLAGSETSSQEPGYLAGAIIAARRAVEDVCG
ncbi:amine oxidase [Gluconobacter japonicus]|uniref:flavin monoamine oxidase family protein n=1 Tax=Gluconobacter japonicus TaxID=376620 RepID=UPI00078395E2|nr:FAD-dependent oxidoreductase [Gluconobacter japonicus]KXV23815.1 amine oxidase [Gluconobacter japonicus]KXV41631.1 amine oxidase [Gluconobacter japonicus]